MGLDGALVYVYLSTIMFRMERSVRPVVVVISCGCCFRFFFLSFFVLEHLECHVGVMLGKRSLLEYVRALNRTVFQ